MKHDLPPLDWNGIEERIRPHVKALRDVGYRTTGSCGHDMWITVEIAPMEVLALTEAMKRLGYRDFQITYTVHEGFHRWQGARIEFGGDLAGDKKPFDLVLLKVDPEAHPLYFVLSYPRRSHTEDRDADGDSYFFDEHTCPTNWTDCIVGVISRGDEDPHGFATFVRRIPAPPGMDHDGLGEEVWKELFPELE